jgi:hypothetical protein
VIRCCSISDWPSPFDRSDSGGYGSPAPGSARETRDEAGMPPAGEGPAPPASGGSGSDLGARTGAEKLVSLPFEGGTGLEGERALKLGAGVRGRGDAASAAIGRAKGGGFAASGRSLRGCVGAMKALRSGIADRPGPGPFANPVDACDFRRIASATARSKGEDCGSGGSEGGRIGALALPVPGAAGRASAGGVPEERAGPSAAEELGTPAATVGRPGADGGNAPRRIGPLPSPPGGGLNELTAFFPRS